MDAVKWTVVLDRCFLSSHSVPEGLGAGDTELNWEKDLPSVSSEYGTECPRTEGSWGAWRLVEDHREPQVTDHRFPYQTLHT